MIEIQDLTSMLEVYNIVSIIPQFKEIRHVVNNRFILHFV